MENIVLAISVVSLLAAIYGIWQNQALKTRFTNSLGGDTQDSLEITLKQYFEHVQKTDAKLIKLLSAYRELTDMASLASQKISVVRFNPFGDTGGDQSFVLAVLDAHNSGYVLTSIHGREGTRVYVKPIDLGKSKYVLSSEEKQAMGQAMRRTAYKKEETHGKKE